MALPPGSRPHALHIWTCFLLLFLSPSMVAGSHTASFPCNTSISRRQDDEKPFLLRIMPLGASITAGYGPTIENGYRKPLRDQLRYRGWPVNMIGSLVGGDPETFHNRQHEGHKSHIVANMTDNAKLSIERKPNLILINAGTNDAGGANGADPADAPHQMRLLLDYLYKTVDGVTIVLSTLIPRKDAYNDNVVGINAGYRTIVTEYAESGHKIVLGEMNSGFLDTVTDYHDNLHPNEKGYAKMATVWDKAIAEAEEKGLLSEPIDTGIPDYDNGEGDSVCDPVLGAARGPVRTQTGSGFNDGPYIHTEKPPAGVDTSGISIDRKEVLEWLANPTADRTSQIYFAQLVNVNNVDPGEERDELIYCHDLEETECQMVLNVDGQFSTPSVKLDTGLSCLTRGIRWGDVNGDGLDDFICIDQAANMYVAINNGENPPKFEPTSNGGLIREGESWAHQDRVRLGDMDGDGRLDYCLINDQGNIYCWRNGGIGSAPTAEYGGYWQRLVGGYTKKAEGEPEGIGGVYLVDINGDGRSDWVYVHKNGSSTIYINQRGDFDSDGPGLRPHWQRAQSDHPAISTYVSSPGNVFFGRIQGTGRADRVFFVIDFFAPDDSPNQVGFVIANNEGHGGTKLKGDGVFYCDMYGKGWDDYLWVLSTGEIQLFENLQTSPWSWKNHEVIINIDRDRKSIQFGDWDGDGLCDILAIERHTGRVEWWRNTWTEGKAAPTFDGPEWVVDSGSNLCTDGWGIGLYDQALRFADLDGDQRVDYLCMKKDGRTFGHLNKASGLEWKDQVKLPPGDHFDRANFQFADVTGDGRADLIWVDKFTGKAQVWRNDGFTPSAGSSMTWKPLGQRFKGFGRGQNIHFPRLGKLGRADYHDVYPQTAIANTWFNECNRAGEGQDDYPTPVDPDLPDSPTTTRIDLPEATLNESFADLIEKDLIPAQRGDIYEYGLGDGSLRYVEIVLAGPVKDYPDIDCGKHDVPGVDGNTLSCVALSTAWMFYSIYKMGGPVITYERRDGSSSSSLHVGPTQVHHQWHPRGICQSVACMLMTTAPLDEWVAVGNGTHDGVYHEHHFARFGDRIGYRMNRQASIDSSLGKRQYVEQDGIFSTMYWQPIELNTNRFTRWFELGGAGTELNTSLALGQFAEQNVATFNVHDLCVGVALSDESPFYGAISYAAVEQGYPGPSFQEIGGNLDLCKQVLEGIQGGDLSPDNHVCVADTTGINPDEDGLEEEEDFDPYGPLPWQEQDSLEDDNPDDGGVKRSLLAERGPTSGRRRTFKVPNVRNRGVQFQWQSRPYPTGNNGDDLNDQKDNNDNSNYGFATDNCDDDTLTNNANSAQVMQSEHIIEEQSINIFLQFIQQAEMDLADGSGVQQSGLLTIPYDLIRDYANLPYDQWALPPNYDSSFFPTDGSSMISQMAEAIGSSTNPNVMVNLQSNLNNYKASIYNAGRNPISDARWRQMTNNLDKTRSDIVFRELRLGLGVFGYLNDNHILDLARAVYEGLDAAAELFDRAVAGLHLAYTVGSMQSLLERFHLWHTARIQNNHRRFMRRRLDQLDDLWRARLQDQSLSNQDRNDGLNARRRIRAWRSLINSRIRYDASDYMP